MARHEAGHRDLPGGKAVIVSVAGVRSRMISIGALTNWNASAPGTSAAGAKRASLAKQRCAVEQLARWLPASGGAECQCQQRQLRRQLGRLPRTDITANRGAGGGGCLNSAHRVMGRQDDERITREVVRMEPRVTPKEGAPEAVLHRQLSRHEDALNDVVPASGSERAWEGLLPRQ